MLKKVLILDDETELLELWPWHFRQWGEEVEIFTAVNGEEGVKLLEEHGKFDLIITDYKMPVMDGFRFISHVRDTDSKTPIFLFAGYIPELDAKSKTFENVLFFEKPTIGGSFRTYVRMCLSGQTMKVETL